MEQNCRYSCGFCDVDRSKETTSTPADDVTQLPAADLDLPPVEISGTDPEHILVNITYNSTMDILSASEGKESDMPFLSSSSNSSATKPTLLWQVSNQTTTGFLNIFYNHLAASSRGMEDVYEPEVTEEPHFEEETTGASQLGNLSSEVQVNNGLTSSPGEGTPAVVVKEDSSKNQAVWNTSVSVDFVEDATTPSRQRTSAYEQMTSEKSDVMELTVLPDGMTPVGNKSSENPVEVPNALTRTAEESSILTSLLVSTTGAMGNETATKPTMDRIADEEMAKRTQQTSDDTASQSTLSFPTGSGSLEVTTTKSEITEEMPTRASNGTSGESSAERTTASDTKTPTNDTSSALKVTEGGVAGGIVTNMTTTSSSTTTTTGKTQYC